ncbi:MAG TPA: site-specific integrase [Rubrobacteraceae bacterium]|nr:site-specific integrase [Rubrobacteraceae bacterium]
MADGQVALRDKTIYGKTRREVDEKLTKAKADRDGSLIFDADNLKVDRYLQRWLNDSAKCSVKPVTFENYERLVRNHIAPGLGRVKLTKLSPAHVQGFYQESLDAGLSPTSVRQMHAILHRALRQAHRWRLVRENVVAATDPPKPRGDEIRPLDAAQAKAFLAGARDERLEALYVLAVTAGLRIGELLGLRWDDVDLGHGTLRVQRTLSAAKSGPKLTTPKNGKGRT